MYPIGQILNFYDHGEFEGGGTENFHAPLHGKGAAKLDEDESSKVIEFIDQYITCSLPMNSKCSELNDLVKKQYNHINILTHAGEGKVPSVGLMHLDQ